MKKQITITGITTLIFLTTLVMLTIVLFAIVYIGRVPEKLREGAFNNFDNCVNENTERVKDIFIKNTKITTAIDNIQKDMYQEFGSLENITISSREDQLDFLKATYPNLISMLSYTNAFSAFIILENNDEIKEGFIENEGMYISKNSNIDENVQPYEIKIINPNLEVDSDFVFKDGNIDRFKIGIEDDNNNYYYNLKQNLKQLDNSKIIPCFSFKYQDLLKQEVINIAYPIYDINMNLAAIVGVELLVTEFLNITAVKNDITYVLGSTSGDSFTIKPLLTWGKVLNIQDNVIKLNKLPSYYNYYQPLNNDEVAIKINRLDLYPTNNPYSNELWVLVGVISVDDLVYGSNFVAKLILGIVLAILIFGVTTILLTYNKIAKPIRELTNRLKRLPTNHYLELEKSNVEEVNDLILAVEERSYNIIQYSSKLKDAIDSFLLGIYFYQNNQDGIYCTQSFLNICGINLSEGYIDREKFDTIYKDIITSYYDERYEAYLIKTNRWIKLETKSEGNFTLGIVTDLTEHVLEIKKVERELEIDGLTQLYNRIAFMKLGSEYIKKHSDKVIAVIMWDIDKLKYINDRYGHDVGDKYIMKFADAIRMLEKQEAIVARRSGDEFFGIIKGDSKDEILKGLKKISSFLNQSILEIGSYTTERIRASVGLAWYPENGNDLNGLLKHADRKLYQSKYEFKYSIGSANLPRENSVNLYHYTHEISKIIDGDYITFVYQPIVDTTNGEIYGYEMLMRIFSDILNNPKKLLDIAKEENKQDSIEELTFQRGFESYQLNKSNIDGKKIFLNSISSAKIANKAINEVVTLTNNKLDMFVVELTDILSADIDFVLNKVRVLKSLNAEIAVDNFKSDFISRINTTISMDYIKVDISIINEIEHSKEKQDLLNEIISYAKGNNCKVIAVGVKNVEELEIVINSGVDFVQGYYLGEPTVKPTRIKYGIISEINRIQAKLKSNQ